MYINIVDFRKNLQKGHDLSAIKNPAKLRKAKQEIYSSYYSMAYITPPAGSQERGDKWELNSRFMVRGHWRNQAHGEGFKKHKLIWIEPYIKGSEGMLKNKKYKVK